MVIGLTALYQIVQLGESRPVFPESLNKIAFIWGHSINFNGYDTLHTG